MKLGYFPWDFAIIFSSAFLFGFILRDYIFKNGIPVFKNARLLPYCYSFLIASLIVGISIRDLPLKFYTFNRFKHSFEAQLGPSPQGINPEGIIFGIGFLLSMILNIGLWAFAITIIVRYYRWKQRQQQYFINSKN